MAQTLVNLSEQVSGTLPVIHGGTGAATLSGILFGNGTGAITGSSNTLGVANGGTGATSLTAAGIEQTANKNAASGYAGLGAGGLVAPAQLGSGSASASTFLRGDQTYAAPPGAITLASTATAAGTTTLTSASAAIQVFTGATTQTVVLPTTGVSAGAQWMIMNQSTGAVTVQASGGATVLVLAGGTSGIFSAGVATPTTAANWDSQYGALTVASGKSLTANNSLILSGTDATTMTFPASDDVVIGAAAAQVVANKTFDAPSTLFRDNSDSTKFMHFDASPLTTGTTRILSLPDMSAAVLAEASITSTAARTLTSQTAAQKLFATPTNGQITLAVGTYFFDCLFTLSAMSSTSGSFGFGLGGTATRAEFWQTEGNKATLATAASAQNTFNLGANTAIVTATTGVVGWAHVWGKVRITVAGTIIPQVSLGVAAAAIVGADSHFRIVMAGPATMTSVGPWS